MAQQPQHPSQLQAIDPNTVTDHMIKAVLDEICTELDDDNSGTVEKDEVRAYSEKMLIKLRPKA